MNVYQILPNLYLGSILENVQRGDGIPFGYTRTPIPENIPEGMFVVWAGTRWELTSEAPSESQQPNIQSLTTRHLKITNIYTSDINSIIDNNDVTVKVGSEVSVTVEIQSADGSIIPFTGTYRVPLISRDGRERFLLASFNDGIAVVSAILTESGRWIISQDEINRDLPEPEHIQFNGLSIVVIM